MPRLLATALLLASAARGSAEAGPPGGAHEAVVVVELFTSEGCSSCPPGDALLAELVQAGVPGIRVVALSEHVDYWDGPAWRDRFSSPVFTRRQEAYARRLGLSAVFTPQLVVAGRTSALGSDPRAARAAMASAAGTSSARVALRLVPRADAELYVAVDATWPEGVRADVLVAVVQDRATSHVSGGENAGRTLEHVAVVRTITAAGAGTGTFSGHVTLGAGSVAGAGHVVAFVQGRDGGPVLGTATLPLP